MKMQTTRRGANPILLVAFVISVSLGGIFLYQLLFVDLTLPTSLQAATWLCLSTVFLFAIRRRPHSDIQEPCPVRETDSADETRDRVY
jgi:membrane protein implicated in regulation of membrane protease activity